MTYHRPLYIIAEEITKDWPKINPYAGAYLKAMKDLGSIKDMYYLDPATDIVARFLCNAQGWRGPGAIRIKTELKAQLKTVGY